MNIQSHFFVLLYLPALLVLWRLTPKLHRLAPRVLLVGAGVLFCGWTSPLSLLVLAAEGIFSYLLGRTMLQSEQKKKPLLVLGILGLLGVLIFFKYTGFLLSLTPWETSFSPPAWLAPLGLSFVTFQQLFWLRDCYAREIAPDVTPLDYACCLTFFATVTCGPITRVGELVPQLRAPAPFSWEELSAGLYCFSLGLAKKTLLSAIFAGGADYGFSHAAALNSADAFLSVLCYTLQIYFDFSGYCDMAAGMARMMGIQLPVNFDSPYQATSIQEFWRRWHITLSRFFRSCVYIPLGGNRRGLAVTCRNIFLIFLLSGIWHGAGWGFLIWGTMHGAAMVLNRLVQGKIKVPKVLGWVVTFTFVNVAWIFFRAGTLTQAVEMIHSVFYGGLGLPSMEFAGSLPLSVMSKGLAYLQSQWMPGGRRLTYWLPLLSIPVGMLLLACPNPLKQVRETFRPAVWKAVLSIVCLVVSVIFFSGVDTFIYANF